MDRNRKVKVSLWEGDDSEKAQIDISSIGSLTELRFGQHKLTGVAKLTSLDLKRIFDGIREAEGKRIDPEPRMLEALEYIADRIDYLDEDKSRLYIQMQLELPIASSGSVMLEPNFEDYNKENRDE